MRWQGWLLPIAFLVALMLSACGETSKDKGDASPAGEQAQQETAASVGAGQEDRAGGRKAAPHATLAAPNEETAGLPDITIGSPDAPITLIEYASLTCPHCAHFESEIFPELKRDYIDTGKVRYVFRNFILNGLDLIASTAVRCQPADMQQPLIELLYARQREWMRNVSSGDRETILSDLAATFRRAGVSRADFDRCIKDKDLQKKLVEMTKIGTERHQVAGTPTFILNGRTLPPIGDYETLKKEIEKAL
ncbi:MAG: DsbA family protein [Alphaproteobacteria bacterium]|nr:MAG: DsbA family protein [Alphaproteobacteria bacterium]